MTLASGPQTFHSVEEFSAAAQSLDVPWKIGSTADRFTASIRRRDFDGCLFGEMRYDPCYGERGSEEIDRSSDRYLCLTLYTDGQLRFMQHGKVIDANRHELMLWDGSAPSQFDCAVTTRCEMIWFPRDVVERRVGKEAVGQRLQPRLARDHRLCSPLGLERQVQIFELLLRRRRQHRGAQGRRELALLFDTLQHRSAPLLQLPQVGQPYLERAQLRVVEAFGGLLAVAGDEREGRAALEEIERGLDLRPAQRELGGDHAGHVERDGRRGLTCGS